MNLLDVLGEGVETTTVANVKTGSIADRVVTLNLSAKNTKKIEAIEHDFLYIYKNKKGMFFVSDSLREKYPTLEAAGTGFNNYFKPATNQLFVSICSQDDSLPEALQPTFYYRKKNERKGNSFTAASLSYYAERAGLMTETEEGSTYFNLVPYTEKKMVEGVETDVVVENLFLLQLASITLAVETKVETPIATPAPVAAAPVIAETSAFEIQELVEDSVEIVVENPVAVVEETLAVGEGSFVDEIDDMMNAVNQAIS